MLGSQEQPDIDPLGGGGGGFKNIAKPVKIFGFGEGEKGLSKC